MSRLLSTEKLAEMVKAKREERLLTQEELSSLTGINSVAVARIERGNFIPSAGQLEALSEALGFDAADVCVDSPMANSLIELNRDDLSESEKEGFDKLVYMMLCLRQQYQLRKKFEEAAD